MRVPVARRRRAPGFKPGFLPQVAIVVRMLLHGLGIRETERAAGCHRDTATRIRRAVVFDLGRELICACGRPSSHRGMCDIRRARREQLLVPEDLPRPLTEGYAPAPSEAEEIGDDLGDARDGKLDLERFLSRLPPEEVRRLWRWAQSDASETAVRTSLEKLRARLAPDGA